MRERTRERDRQPVERVCVGGACIFFFWPTSRNFLSTFQTYCPVAQVVHIAHFQVQARKRDVLGWSGGLFVDIHIPERCL